MEPAPAVTTGPSRSDPAWLAVVGIALLVPIALGGLGVNRWLVADPFESPKLLTLCLLAFVAATTLAWRLARGEAALRFHPAYGWAFGFLGMATVSAAFGVSPPQAFLGGVNRHGLLAMFVQVLVGLLAMQLVRTPERIRSLQAAVLAGGVPVALLALLQVLRFDRIDWGAGVPVWYLARGVSTFGNPDMLGGYLVLPMVLGVAYALTEEDARRRLVAWAGCAIVGVALFATLTRGAWVGGLLGVGVLGAAAIVQRVKPRRLDLGVLGVWLAGVAWIAAVNAEMLVPRIRDLVTGAAATTSGRLALWEVGLRAIPKHWLLGVGPDSFRYAYMPLRPADHEVFLGSSVVADDAHNYLIMLAVTVGVPALLVACAFFARTVSSAWKLAFARGAGAGRLPYAGWLAALLGYCGYLFFGPGTVTSNALAWLALGVLLSARAKPVGTARPVVVAGAWAVTAIALVGAGFASAIALASHDVERSYTTSGTEALAYAQRARATMPLLAENRVRLAEVAGGIALTEAQLGATPQALAAADVAVAAYEDAIAFAPRDYEARVLYAGLLNELVGVRGPASAEKALEVARDARALYPAGLHAVSAEAYALVNLRRPAEAVELLADVWDSDPYFAEPGVRYAQALWAAGDKASARDVVARLRETFPDDAAVASFAAALEGSGAE